MEENQMIFKKIPKKIALSLAEKSHFTVDQITALATLFKKNAKDKVEKMDRLKFRDVLHKHFKMTEDLLMDRIFKVFDKDNDSLLSLDEWVMGMSIFLLGTMEEKTLFCFNVYNITGDLVFGRDEMFQLLKSCIARQPPDEDPDEGVRDLVELVLKKMDHDLDGRISFEDFKQSVQSDALFLEIFGNCIPSPQASEAFMQFMESLLL